MYTTLTVANRIGRSEQFNDLSEKQKAMHTLSQKTEQWIMEFLGMLAFSRTLKKPRHHSSNDSDKRRGTSFRRIVAARTAVRLILILSLPQAVIQIFVASFYDSYVTFVEQGQDESVLVQKCYNDNGRYVRPLRNFSPTNNNFFYQKVSHRFLSFPFRFLQVGIVFWKHSTLHDVRVGCTDSLVFPISSLRLQRKRPGMSLYRRFFALNRQKKHFYWHNTLTRLPFLLRGTNTITGLSSYHFCLFPCAFFCDACWNH